MNVIARKDGKTEELIYNIRGVEVMLDSDVAKLYLVQTKRINEAVRNNKENFQKDIALKLMIKNI